MVFLLPPPSHPPQGTSIEATFWRDAADRYYDALEDGKVSPTVFLFLLVGRPVPRLPQCYSTMEDGKVRRTVCMYICILFGLNACLFFIRRCCDSLEDGTAR